MKKNKLKIFTEIAKRLYNVVRGEGMLIEQFPNLQLEIVWDEYIVPNVSQDIVNRFNEQMDSLNVLVRLHDYEYVEKEKVFAWMVDSQCDKSFTQYIGSYILEVALIEAEKVKNLVDEILDDFEKNMGVRSFLAYHYEEESEYGMNIRGAYFYIRGSDVLELNGIGKKLNDKKVKLYHNSYF